MRHEHADANDPTQSRDENEFDSLPHIDVPVRSFSMNSLRSDITDHSH